MSSIVAERSEKLKSVISSCLAEGKTFNIVLNHHDPDAWGSGFGLKHYLKCLGASMIKILYCGEAGTDQNEIIANRYDLFDDMISLEKFWPTRNIDKDVFILADSCSSHDRRLNGCKDGFEPIIVIDHHDNPHNPEANETFVWVPNGVGACSTLVFNLLEQENFLTFNKDNGDDMFVLMLLALGIYADTTTTHALTLASANDLEVYAKLRALVNDEEFLDLSEVQESVAFVNAENYARSHYTQNGLRIVACAGYLTGKKPVYVAQLANKFINFNGVSLVVVFAVTDDRRLIFSIRSTDPSLELSLKEVVRREFGDGAGVKKSEKSRFLEGGGQVSLGINLAGNVPTRERYFEVAIEYMNRIFLSEELR